MQQIIIAIVMYACGSLLFSFGIMQIILVLTCAIPATKNFCRYGPADTKTIYRKCAFTIVLWLVISALAIGAVIYFGGYIIRFGFFFGIAISFLFSIRKWGMTTDNIQDYIRAYGVYYSRAAIESIVSGEEPTYVVQKEKRKKSFYLATVLGIFCTLLAAGLVCVSVLWWDDSTKFRAELAEKQAEINQIRRDYERKIELNENEIFNLQIKYNRLVDNQDAYNFYHRYACIVTGAGEKYHSYGCHYLENMSSYWIFNIEYAKYLGYEPCQYCNPGILNFTGK